MPQLLRTRLVCFVGVLIVFSLTSPVFAGDQFPDYALSPPDTYAVTAKKTNLMIGVQPVEDLHEQETYFGAKMAAKGFLPVFVVIKNESNGESVLFDKAKLTYGPANSGVLTPKSGSKAGESFAFAAIPFVGPFAAMKVITSASQVQQNILKKELQSTTLSPGTSARGFVYIPVPKDTVRQKINLRISLSRPGADEDTVFELAF